MADLEFHPLANLFPLIEGDEFADLVEDIKKNGLRDTIMMHEGKVLDGRNRYRACLEAGVKPITREYREDWPHHGNGGALGYVLSVNLHRRHLTTEQRAAIAAELATLDRGGDRRSDDFKVSNDPLKPALTVKEAAKALKVSPASVKRAKQRKAEDPAAHAQAKAGTLPRKKPVPRIITKIRKRREEAERSGEPHQVALEEAEGAANKAGTFVGDCPGCGQPFGDHAPVKHEGKWWHPACAQPTAAPVAEDPVSRLMAAYRTMRPRERNEAAKQILEAQLQETDLLPKQKADLGKVLEVLTDYTRRAEH